jgi:multicomponent Na+:H+ antiporter subunit E
MTDREAGDAPRLARAAAVRAALFLGFWLMISGWAAEDLPFGLAAVAVAAWASLALLPAKTSQIRITALLVLAFDFVRQSVVSGFDVARRALRPHLRLEPGFVRYPVHLPPGNERNAFCAIASLLPGTLPTGTDEHGVLLVHSLDVGQSVASNLAAEETLFMRTLGRG